MKTHFTPKVIKGMTVGQLFFLRPVCGSKSTERFQLDIVSVDHMEMVDCAKCADWLLRFPR